MANYVHILRVRLSARYRSIIDDMFDGYRPERYYMRGPGPKWQEKYGQKYAQKYNQEYGQPHAA